MAAPQSSVKTVAPPNAAAAKRHLSRVDPVMARIIDEVGPYRVRVSRGRFQALARAILFQQLAGRAALAIYGRFVALFPGRSFPTPEQVIECTDEDLRKAGVSRQKAVYLRDLAAHIANKSLNFHRFAAMSDDEIIGDLTRVKGIGRWTAEIFLMFNLGRPDVLPLDDLGLRIAARQAYKMEKLPSKRELEELGELWRPYRSAASWYLWQSTRIVLPDAAPSPPPAPAAPKPNRLRKG
jgi:DNA-3-methyladenine glycosylase II